MARPKLPLAKARLTGAAAQNPQRYRGLSEPQVMEPIGAPPSWLPAPAKVAWRDFCRRLPWLVGSDRAILASASILQAQIAEGGPLTVALFREYRAHLGCLGATPVDRNRIHWSPAREDGDEFAVFDRTSPN